MRKHRDENTHPDHQETTIPTEGKEADRRKGSEGAAEQKYVSSLQ